MTYIDRAIIAAAKLFIPAGWELIEQPPEIIARQDGQGGGRIAFGFYLKRVDPISTEHLRRK